MGRWKANARERLEQAALELLLERGYERATVAEITERAGLTKRTFFRHFADKREVLFSGQETLYKLFVGAIVGAPASATAIDAIGAALEAASVVFPPERRELARQRQAIIAGNTELQEREMLKRASLAAAMVGALRERGVTDPTASLAAELGGLAFRTAYARWVDPANHQEFAELARQALHELKTATSEIA
jgi:AcrR family transcriptional regulator